MLTFHPDLVKGGHILHSPTFSGACTIAHLSEARVQRGAVIASHLIEASEDDVVEGASELSVIVCSGKCSFFILMHFTHALILLIF